MKFNKQTEELYQILKNNSDEELIEMIRATAIFLSDEGKIKLLSALKRINIKPETNIHNGFFTEKTCYFCSTKADCMRVTSIDDWICYYCNKLAVANYAKEVMK